MRKNIKDVYYGEKKDGFTSRTAFIESLGATCKNWQWSWSFVNNEKKFVIFGEWLGRSDRKPGLIFSNDWEIRNGRENRGFRQGLEHIRLIIEEGYKLLTFPMIANEKDEKSQGRVRIEKFICKVTEKTLLKKGDGWYAHPINKEIEALDKTEIEKDEDKGAWPDEEISASVSAYLKFLYAEKAGIKLNKREIYRSLAAKSGRSSKSIYCLMTNISYVLQLSGRSTVNGLEPVRHVGINVLKKIEDALAEFESRPVNTRAMFEAEVAVARTRKDLAMPSGSKVPSKAQVTTTTFTRSPEVKAWVLFASDGRCEACKKEAPFLTYERVHFLEVHHVRHLAEGGSDTIDNAVAVCPNCHRALHYAFDKVARAQNLYKVIKRLIRQ